MKRCGKSSATELQHLQLGEGLKVKGERVKGLCVKAHGRIRQGAMTKTSRRILKTSRLINLLQME
ncbi:MAG: hypothetical protein IKW43_08915 [Bacteroidaceae bacterium]|nr:hypothetical protein [Bacteroidaceae bacterium]